MTNDTATQISVDTAELLEKDFDEEYETTGDHHRMAARHFAAAAKHHLAAAVADDDGDIEAAAQQAFSAYRHQLNAVQYAEIAVMDAEGQDGEWETKSALEEVQGALG